MIKNLIVGVGEGTAGSVLALHTTSPGLIAFILSRVPQALRGVMPECRARCYPFVSPEVWPEKNKLKRNLNFLNYLVHEYISLATLLFIVLMVPDLIISSSVVILSNI